MGPALAPASRPGDGPPPLADAGGSPAADDRRVDPRHLLAVAVLGLLLAVVLLRPWPLDAPVLYGGDVFQHLAIVEATDATGTPGTSVDLSAPGSVDWSVFPTGAERLQLVVLHALDAVTGDVVVALNLYLLLGVAVTAVVAFAVLRWTGLRPLLAGAAALPFSVGPAVTAALVGGHVFLFALYPIALGTWLALWSTMTPASELRRRPSQLAWPAAAAVATGLSSAYYTSFSVIVIVAVGLAAAVRTRRIGRLLVPAATAAGLVAVMGLSLLPDLVRRAGDPAASALRRTAADVWRYSLRPQDLLVLDEAHPLSPVWGWARSVASGNVTGATGTVLGLVALAGCLAAVVVAARHGRSPRDRADRVTARLAVVVVTVLAVASVGGLGTWLAEVGVTQIRAWSRMAVFLSFAGLATVALIAQRALDRADWERRRTATVVCACAALVLLDQGLPVPDRAAAEARARSDRQVVEAIVDRYGSDVRVFEVPVVSFPDDPGSGRLLAPAVWNEDGPAFSAGFFRGGAQDWQLSWCRRPTGQFARALAAAGFDVLLVQVDHHLVRDPDELEGRLTAVLGPPVGTGEDGSFTWYDLRALRSTLVDEHGESAVDRAGELVRRPIGVDYQGVTELRREGRVMDGGGEVVLRPLDDDTSSVELTMRVVAGVGGRGAADRVVRTVEIDGAATHVVVPGDAPVTVSELSVIDERALVDPVLAAPDGPALPAVCM